MIERRAEFKMSKASNLREMSAEQLGAELEATKRQLFDLRIKSSTEKLDSPSQIRKTRRQIARIKTIVHQREQVAKTA